MPKLTPLPRVVYYPLCESRDLLLESPKGTRASFTRLHQSFTQWERARWYSYAGGRQGDLDEYGITPELVEDFLYELVTFVLYPEPGVLYVRC